jgi:hypothetical protein
MERIARLSYHIDKKKEATKIDIGNKLLMERIISSAGTINYKEMEKSYK